MRLAVLDSCASGALTRVKGGSFQAPFLVDDANKVKGYAILTSSSADEAAQESDRLQASFFTHSLVSGLRGAADTTGDSRVTLNAGSDKGVVPNIAVVTARGLLGVVSTVDQHTCQVILVTSGSIKVGGLIVGDVSVPGLVKGQSPTRLVMDVFDPVDVKTGSEVVTTGYSEQIPRGSRIGIVSLFYKNEEFGTRFAYVLPSARIGLAKEVYILK